MEFQGKDTTGREKNSFYEHYRVGDPTTQSTSKEMYGIY